MAYNLTAEPIALEDLEHIYREKSLIQISPDILEKLSNANAQINKTNSATAEAFLAAHGLSFGPAVPEEVIRLALVLQLSTLLLPANQPVQAETIQRLLAFYNREVWPVVHEQGLPASQLTQLGLPLLGLGKVSFQGYELNAADVMDIFSWQPLSLSAPEINNFTNQNTFTYAYLLHNLFRLAPVLNWLEYLIGVFDGISSDQPASLLFDSKILTENFENTRKIIQQNYALPPDKQDLHQVRDAVIDLLQNLITVTTALTDLTAETYDNLVSTSEPPATTSFALASDLVQSLQKQLKLTGINPTDTIILTKDMRMLHQALSEAINLTEQIIALAFWSVSQVDKVFSLTPGNLTLSAYYHSAFFVPKEAVSDQLQKIIDFTRITTPAPIT
ncbi:MAG: aromatic amino acid lyase [Adhaeribacter sp.]